jgi:prepilin-type N-terminal cleavage/methylation domain-containing protein
MSCRGRNNYMTTLRQRGFTLPELLMGMVLMLIIIGSVVMVLKSGLDLYTKTETNSLVIQGVRFTADSYRRRIVPMLSNASEVEVIDSNLSIPATPGTNNHYIYLSDNRVMHKSQSKTMALEGSEYIDSLEFLLPTSSEDISTNYNLKMNIGGLSQKYHDTANLDIMLESPLYNKPLKSGSTIVAGNYSGKVLRFVASEISFDIVLKDVKIKKDSSSGEDVSNSESVAKGTTLYASYNVVPSEDPGYTLQDCSDVRWYISGSSSVNVNPAAAESGLPIPSTGSEPDNRTSNSWLLVDSSNTPLTGKTLSTNGTFYVRTVNGVRSWGNYGIIRYYVKSAMQKTDGSGTVYGPEKQSPFVAITTAGSARGGRLWREWMKSLQDIQSGGPGTEGFFNTGLAGVELQIDYVTGETHLIARRPAGGTAGSVTVAVSGGYLFEDEKKDVIETDGKSYTTLTNYSLLVDADVLAGNGYALLLSGASVSNSPSQFADCGYMFQYDQAIDAFPMRLYADGHHNSNGETKHYGMSIQYEEDSNNLQSRISGVGYSGANYGPFYGPGHMKNSIFSYISNSTWTNRPLYQPWTSRRRFVITILEYYINGTGVNQGPQYPRFIMRLKLLKNYNEILGYDPIIDDPWQIGKEAFYSEPVWYGGFVGDPTTVQHQKKDSNNSPYYDVTQQVYNATRNNRRRIVYRYFVKNHSPYTGNYVEFTSQPTNADSKNRYIAKMPWGTSYSSNSDSDFLVFNAVDMNVRNEIKTGSFLDIGTSVGIIDRSFQDPERKRYIGLRIWGNTGTASRFYSVNYAPGFRKSELQAIMPVGAKMYELNQTGEDTVLGLDQTNLNQGLFGITGYSNGNGNASGYYGVMDIQHLSMNCVCPMCK